MQAAMMAAREAKRSHQTDDDPQGVGHNVGRGIASRSFAPSLAHLSATVQQLFGDVSAHVCVLSVSLVRSRQLVRSSCGARER